MAGETIIEKGSYTQLIASEAEADGNFCTISSSLDTLVTDGSELYPLLDFKLDVTAGTISSGSYVELFRVPMDGTDQAPTPTSAYLQHSVGTFQLLAATQDEYYLFGVPNVDENDKFIWRNMDGTNSLTCTLYVRGRGFNTAA